MSIKAIKIGLLSLYTLIIIIAISQISMASQISGWSTDKAQYLMLSPTIYGFDDVNNSLLNGTIAKNNIGVNNTRCNINNGWAGDSTTSYYRLFNDGYIENWHISIAPGGGTQTSTTITGRDIGVCADIEYVTAWSQSGGNLMVILSGGFRLGLATNDCGADTVCMLTGGSWLNMFYRPNKKMTTCFVYNTSSAHTHIYVNDTYYLDSAEIIDKFSVYSNTVGLKFSNFRIWNVTLYGKDGPQAATGGGAATAPTVTFNKMSPYNITVFNVVSADAHINYSITPTDTYAINSSSVKIYYKTNDSQSDITYTLNGLPQTGYFSSASVSNKSNLWEFEIDDNDIYPGSYNYNFSLTEKASHTGVTLSNNYAAKVRLYNVSGSKNFSFFEVMANTTGTRPLNIYYCNDTYTSGNIGAANGCTLFYSLEPRGYNHSHSNSSHQVIPFIPSNGKINGIGITSTSYFVLTPASTSWIIYKQAETLDASASRISTNSGVSWTNVSGTYDAHIHQYSDTTLFHHYAYACTTGGACASSSLTSELIDIENVPPSPAIILYPTGNQTLNGVINVTWNNATPQPGKSINNYTLQLYDSDFIYVSELTSTKNLYYLWNTGSLSGYYYLKLNSQDSSFASSYTYSNNITIDNEIPSILFLSPTNGSIIENTGSFTVNMQFSDNLLLYGYSYNITYLNKTMFYNSSGLLSGVSDMITNSIPSSEILDETSFYLNTRLCDAHTALEIAAYPIRTAVNSLTYTINEKELTIKSISGNEVKASTTKLTDRYSFDFEYSDTSTIRVYEIIGNLSVIYLKDSPFKAHFVIDDKYWLDFEGSGKATVSYKDGRYQVTVENQKAAKTVFNSLGELNCVVSTINFRLQPPYNPYNTETIKKTYWFNNAAINTNTTPGVLILFFLFGIFAFLVWMAEKLQIPFFALITGVYGFFVGMLIYTIISAVLGFIICFIGAMYGVRSILMAR